MKLKVYGAVMAAVLLAGIIGTLILLPAPVNTLDAVKINDLIQSGEMIDKTVFDEPLEQWRIYRIRLQSLVIVILLVFAGTFAVLLLRLHNKILRPFKRMRGFAQRVAAGDLDMPLEMDEGNIFGAFTESFDLMRDELRRARENEKAAEQSKRELVASLSHDIQTPVSSIRAVAEVMEITADENQRQKLDTIQQKAGQIHTLVNDLFHAALEELNRLKVTPAPFPSDRLAKIIKNADYQNKVKLSEIPGCLIQADPVRIAQVVDNIIVNSYKYADTAIDASAEIVGDALILSLRDYGPGAGPDEIPLLCRKYYRGKTADGKSGYGLGLFISRTLTERMGGRLECENAAPGFMARIWLKLDG